MSALDDIKARVDGHAPGPWHVAADTDEACGVQSSDGPLTWDDHGGDVFRNRADAELIAAAPKLLAALEAVEDVLKKLDAIQEEDNVSRNACAGGIASVIRDVMAEEME